MRRTWGTTIAAVALPLAALAASAPHAGAAPAGTAGADPGCTTSVQGRTGTWTRRPVPVFPAGPQRIVSHAIDPHQPDVQLVTNGTSLLRTDDGCAWRETWRVPAERTADLPASAETDRLVELHVHPRTSARVWAVVAVGGEVAERVGADVPLSPADGEARDGTSALVLRSSDGGRTWQPPTRPVPADGLLAGTPGALAPSPVVPDLLWLPTAGGLHASSDGGASWRLLPAALTTPVEGRRPLDGITSPVLQRVAASPDDSRVLLGRTTTPVRSTDGGLTWRAHPTPAGHWSGPFAATTPGGTALFGRQPDSTSPVEELYAGVERLQPTPAADLAGVPWRAAWHPSGGELLVATGDRGSSASFPEVSLYRITAAGEVTDVDDLGLPPVRGVLADDAGGYHLHTGSELVSLLPASVLPPGPQVEISPFGTTTPAPPDPVRLGVPGRVVLSPGEERQVDVDALVPRRPRPLDTYFLLDTSSSFDRDLQQVADSMADVVRTLRTAGVDAWFGVGELGTQEARRYHRHADLAAPGTALVRGFESLRTGGGVESHLIALHQTATGSGVEGTVGPDVAPGQSPSWRPDALRTLLVVTDVQFSDEDDPDAPSRAETYSALAATGVRVVALEVVREGGDDGVPGSYAAVEAADAAGRTVPTPARRDLEELARATGSFAPAGGVDCRDNGTTELRAGDPLVCTTTQLHLADRTTLAGVLRRVLLAQEDRARARLRVSSPAGVRPQGSWTVDGVDLRRDQRLGFAATLSCRPAQAGQSIPVRWRLEVAGEVVSDAVTRISCGESASTPARAGRGTDPAEVVREPGSGPAPAPVLGGQPGLAAAPPAGPAPVTAGGTASSTATGTASSTASSTGSATGTAPGTATRPEDDLQLAHATVLAGGAMAAAAAALQRRRTSPRTQRSTR